MRGAFVKAGALVLIGGLAAAAQAADTFLLGDVMASTSSGHYEQWRKVSGVWTKIDTLSTGGSTLTTGSAFDSAGNFYGTTFNGGFVAKFAGPGVPHTFSNFSTTDSGGDVESITFDAAGNVYVGQADGSADVLKLDGTTGAILARYDVALDARGSDWITLAADQKTLYYTSEGRKIKRFDVSTNTQLTDFATLSGTGNAFALRLLGDGGLLVADRSDVKRLDATGAVVQTYDVTGINNWFALNLDPDGTTFWSGSFGGTGPVYRFNIATGAVVDSFSTGSTGLYGLSVFGEIVESVGVPLPPAAWMGLSLLGGLVLVQRRRRRDATL